MIAALYVETNGAYYGLEGVDPWDEARDARLYDGPHPVVAHPPCPRWGKMWFGQPLTVKTTGRRKTKGADAGSFASGLTAVRNFGGVLDASAILEMAAKAVEDHQKQGREWVKGSLWDDLTREASGRIRALKSQLASRKEAPPQATNAAFMARAKHLLDLAEKAEAEALDGDEGCVWPIEALRSAYADLIQPQARSGEGQ